MYIEGLENYSLMIEKIIMEKQKQRFENPFLRKIIYIIGGNCV